MKRRKEKSTSISGSLIYVALYPDITLSFASYSKLFLVYNSNPSKLQTFEHYSHFPASTLIDRYYYSPRLIDNRLCP
ncbi:hypothetical protein AYI69_g3496 [Smittium culicis]|uniref:Uncharacterized protein n=1 Tax=Smittium culicis TaxID=133412 RepID=A0A1R1YK28_9FUNG|nr:hypothetical protein AYI69_g3496 [Smittium culicis]